MGLMGTLRTWWAGTGDRSARWSLSQSLMGANVFLLLTHSFAASIVDMYSPDVATLIASFGAGAAALISLTSTQLIRAYPMRIGNNAIYHLCLSVLMPVIFIFSIKSPHWTFLVGAVNGVLAAASWRRPPRRKGDTTAVKISELESVGLKVDAENRMTRAEWNLKSWEHERMCFIYIAQAYFAGALHLYSQPLLLILATVILFGWLNAPALLPAGIVTTVAIAFLSRLFHVVGAYNLDWMAATLFVRDRVAHMVSITDWEFWSPLLTSALVMAAIPLGALGIPTDALEKVLDDDRYWISIERAKLVAMFLTFAHCFWYWAFTLVPLLQAVA